MKIFRYIFTGIFCICIISCIITNKYHQLFIALICALLILISLYTEVQEKDINDKHNKS